MKGIFVTARNQLEILELPDPVLGDFDALVEIAACSICNSTDLKIIHGEFVSGTYPILLGHESAGIVTAVGEKVRNYRVGDMVLRPGLADENLPFTGGRSCWGGFAERGIVTDFWAEKGVRHGTSDHPQQIVPSEIPPHEATALITLKENLSCLEHSGIKAGQSLAIVGTGPVARALTACAKLIGISPVVVFGRSKTWQAEFTQFGADAFVSGHDIPPTADRVLDDGGFDMVIEAVGSRSALSKCLEICAADGRVNLYGIPPESDPYVNREESDSRVFRSEVTESAAHEKILSAVECGDIMLADWASHILPWTDFQRGFDLLEHKRAAKVVLVF
jgi:threonine dehydrogenase-like Zn-dependent dehydrogenase